LGRKRKTLQIVHKIDDINAIYGTAAICIAAGISEWAIAGIMGYRVRTVEISRQISDVSRTHESVAVGVTRYIKAMRTSVEDNRYRR
jgi:hypothetical protein